jgi:tetratricopeptide (TPR) repeat protein
MTKGDFDRAIRDYDRAVALDPKSFLAFNNRGFAYSGKGDFDGAIQDYDQAIRLNPDAAMTFYNRGFARAAKGDFDRARHWTQSQFHSGPVESRFRSCGQGRF